MARDTWDYVEKSLHLEPIPDKVKDFFLCKRYRKRSKRYLKEVKAYRAEIDRVTRVNKKHRLNAEVSRIAGMEFAVVVETVTALKPTIHYHISHDEMKEVITGAVSKQGDWGAIVKAMMPPLIRMGTMRGRAGKGGGLVKMDSMEELMKSLYYCKQSYPTKSSG